MLQEAGRGLGSAESSKAAAAGKLNRYETYHSETPEEGEEAADPAVLASLRSDVAKADERVAAAVLDVAGRQKESDAATLSADKVAHGDFSGLSSAAAAAAAAAAAHDKSTSRALKLKRGRRVCGLAFEALHRCVNHSLSTHGTGATLRFADVFKV